MVYKCISPKNMLPGSILSSKSDVEIDDPIFQILPLEQVQKLLCTDNTNIATKIRCLFFGRYYSNDEAVNIIIKSLDFSNSILFRHEAAYVLGQIGRNKAVSKLTELLSDINESPIVRHEAGEALAAIGDNSSIKVIEKFLNDPSNVVAETCYLALHSLKNKQNKLLKDSSKLESDISVSSENNLFNTVDPTLPISIREKSKVDIFSKMLLDISIPLEQRYGALFALRNILANLTNINNVKYIKENNINNNKELINLITNSICSAMEMDNSSAIFRHECAFVLGQLQILSSADSLARTIMNENEESIVRHEAAFALGSVGSNDPRYCDTSKYKDSKEEVSRIRKLAIETLSKYLNDKDIIVVESCIVGLQTIKDETGSLDIILN
ncbi:PBS lyase HEAT-like repeat family protein [Cryptosporidium muris RN66]|uniref:Deoxyhypusine hydroxylase n=1 Tax=Cryptosporidium muris (strain RN66) TaxID=441375 RepID=B6AEG1_CRYMR|nr:PBS lyase HEAT-like repeat family protein [Cryptosporidium muris RN66]EEA06578.1 PBS lyase HEAT-like repeat family protein [Cryptosporidium muris RN66]|eukprot:XP_002140927.1 PBS lyase HEAT-like repeat family protein [Cryptosporidium muris RN66]